MTLRASLLLTWFISLLAPALGNLDQQAKILPGTPVLIPLSLPTSSNIGYHFYYGVHDDDHNPTTTTSTAPPAYCRYWCRTKDNKFFCCRYFRPTTTTTTTKKPRKPGFCPKIRTVCPKKIFGPPVICNDDYECAGTDKCCYDRCIQDRVCKPIRKNWY